MTDPVELAQRWIDAFNARDVDGMLAVAARDIVVRPLRWGVHSEYRGHAGIRAWLAAVAATPEATTVTPDAVRLLSRERIVVEGVIDGADARFVVLYGVRDGLLAEVRAYMSDSELLDQLGLLDEPAAAPESDRGQPGPRTSSLPP
jgi:hypothetical protein